MHQGPCVKVFAPGTDIYSACGGANRCSAVSDASYTWASGTSMAAPHVAGVAALFLAKNPKATPAQVSDAITKSSTLGRLTGPTLPGTPNLLLFSGLTPYAAVATAAVGLEQPGGPLGDRQPSGSSSSSSDTEPGEETSSALISTPSDEGSPRQQQQQQGSRAAAVGSLEQQLAATHFPWGWSTETLAYPKVSLQLGTTLSSVRGGWAAAAAPAPTALAAAPPLFSDASRWSWGHSQEVRQERTYLLYKGAPRTVEDVCRQRCLRLLLNCVLFIGCIPVAQRS